MSDEPLEVVFHDFPADAFPFTIECINLAGDVVWSADITGPGPLWIPGLRAEHGPVSVRIINEDGTVVTVPAPTDD